MGNHMCKTVEFLFFGAGKQGKYWLECCKNFRIVPKGIIDNNLEICGGRREGVPIYSLDALQILEFECIFITCNREEEISLQLSEVGVAHEKIITGRHNILNHILYYADYSSIFFQDTVQIAESCGGKRKILFDLQNGMVLGGVETWTYSIAKKLKAIGYQGLYLTTDAAGPVVTDHSFPVRILQYSGLSNEKDKVALCVRHMIEILPCTIICNFPQNIFWSACIVKRMFPDFIRIIAVQHSDDPLYYEVYSLWKEYIDKCLVISSRIEENLLLLGIERDKLWRLEWEIACENKINRIWRTGKSWLRIGYAGRLTTISKRVDLLPVLTEKLRKSNIDFRISIAGAGEYKENLQRQVREKNLEDYIIFVGYIDQKDISDFWRGQDIMVSCSEREGHSISQSEAMAEGAVPIITDVSGARDDVTDGYNGYVVPVGDMDALADRICDLYANTKKLARMGERAHNTIYRRQQGKDQSVFWNDLIRKIW